MKTQVLAGVVAGLFTVVTAPFAMAAETTTECQLDPDRRSVAQRLDAPAAPAAPNVGRPAATTQREVTPPPASAADQVRQAANDRRRSGKRIPDAELIGPRGAL